jgi:hypothetical protein
MQKIVINLAKILAVISLIIWISLRVFSYWFWSEWDIDRTLNSFQHNKKYLDSLVVWAADQKSANCLQKADLKHCLPPQLQAINKKFNELSVSYNPFIIQITPINFYYVLVYTERPQDVEESEVYHDEGTIIRSIDQNWKLVRRGWM